MLRGSIVALVTPFEASGEIDFDALHRLVRMHLDAGTDGIVVAGSTGESAVLNHDELAGMLEAVCGQVAGQVPVIAGTGTASTDKTIATTRLAEKSGANAALVVTPYYNRPTQHGMVAHYKAVAGNCGLPILLYNVPARTGIDLLPATVEQLVEHPQIVGIKEAIGTPQRTADLLRLCSEAFCLLSGDDPTCLAVMEQGASGVISVVANVVPKRFKNLCDAVARRDLDAARQEENEMKELFDLLMLESNPIAVKWALHEMSLCGPGLRLPLSELSPELRPVVRAGLKSLGELSQH